MDTFKADNSGLPGRPTGEGASVRNLYALYFSNSFIHVRQELHDAYYGGDIFGGNVFKDCVLAYNGGSLHFSKSNAVIDSELEISESVRDSSEAKQLLHDFKWQTVTYTKAPSPTQKFPWDRE